jgi:hypothetical protein
MENYCIRVRLGESEVEVASPEKEFVEKKFDELRSLFLGRDSGQQIPKEDRKGEGSAIGAKVRSLAEHVRQLSPKSGTQYVVAVGSYLEQHGGQQAGFKTRDISDGFRQIRYKHSNPAEAVRQAKQQGFLMDGSGPGSLVLTQTAESWVAGQTAVD